MYRYAVMLRDGIGLPQDYQTSATYFLKAAGYKYKDSGLQYGLLITGNHGVQFMISKTKQYFYQALKATESSQAYLMLGFFFVVRLI